DESMWVADRVAIPETANEFAIKGNHLNLIKGNQFDGRTKTDPHKHIHEFLGICDAMTIKMDARYKELQSRAKQPTPDLDDDDIPMSHEKEAKFKQTFPDLGASINLMPYSLYAKLSLETLKPTKMSVRLADRSFQYLVGIAENMLIEVEDFDALLDEGSKIFHSIEGTVLEEEIFSEFDKFIAMTADENYDSESDTEEPPFEKSPSKQIIKSKHISKNLLRISNSNLFLIT
ncbi:reverse transcriptase domain-containing protein, partial [Tanacetum coccineum]